MIMMEEIKKCVSQRMGGNAGIFMGVMEGLVAGKSLTRVDRLFGELLDTPIRKGVYDFRPLSSGVLGRVGDFLIDHAGAIKKAVMLVDAGIIIIYNDYSWEKASVAGVAIVEDLAALQAFYDLLAVVKKQWPCDF